ncbi:hypothetical protein [Paraglaciecola sp. MB-3u-78]|uniref:hypothetical protein n=1 Tax=Paraglaciecola sp. MB-3u-78 TaxID=2058332 RepID=UPI001E56E6B7|nr:hypothetical protein [Paraglaciecola sp. MB-3u-78]
MPDVRELRTVVFMKKLSSNQIYLKSTAVNIWLMMITILSKMNYLHNLKRRCDLRNCVIRRTRVAAKGKGKGKGKRGGAKVIYYYFDNFERFYLLSI